MLSRRSFLLLSGALITTSSWAALSQQKTGETLYASAYSLDKNTHFFGLFNDEGTILWTAPLPDRAHAPVVHPNQSIIGIVGRRPGFLWISSMYQAARE